MSLRWNNLHSCDKPLNSEEKSKQQTNLFLPGPLHALSTSMAIKKIKQELLGIYSEFWWTNKWLERTTAAVARDKCYLLMSNSSPKFPAPFWKDGTEHLNPKAIYTPVYSMTFFLLTLVPVHISFLVFQVTSSTTFVYLNFRNPLEAAPDIL